MSNETVVPVVVDSPEHAPTYASEGDAGADLRATQAVHLAPLERTLVPTGVKAAIPTGKVGLIHPRSGLAAKKGITVLNAPGTIDSGYRGEIKVILINLSNAPVDIAAGERVAQLLIQDVDRATFTVTDDLDETARGHGGFGSTGAH